MSRKVGFLGLGEIGGALCAWVARSEKHEVSAYDVDAARVEVAAGHGAHAASSMAQLAQAADIIVANLPDPGVVRGVFTGAGGLIESVRPGTVIFDFTTVDPQTSKELASAFAARSALYVDTPHSGSKHDAARGSLPLIVGATEAELKEWLPFLRVVSSSLHFVGARGAGSAVKLVNNVMSMGNLLVAAEAFALGVKAGVDAGTLFNVIQYFGGSSQRLVTRFPSVLKGEFGPRFPIQLAEQHLDIALETARRLEVPMEMAQACREVYHRANEVAADGADVTAVVQFLERLAGVELRGDAQIASIKWGG
ncbi:MAG TPA: NAD(P)-dependent oxidoreductase [Ramlibacter sp.]|nr:NAD(P)-dependent oxidoreductase [Ramlibacter sp.]